MTEPSLIPEVTPTAAPAASEPTSIITPDAPTPGDSLKAPAEKAVEAKYEFKAPEGYDTKELEAFAKEAKLAPEVAQKVLDRELKSNEALNKRQEQEFKNLSEKVWPAEIYNDPKLGGPNIEKTRLNVMKAWQEVPKEVRDDITGSGFHTNPMLIKLLNHFGQMTKEDRTAGPPTNQVPPSKASSGLVGLFSDMK